MIRTDPFAGLMMRLLLLVAPRREDSFWRWTWEAWWNRLAARRTLVRTTLHGRSVVLNAGNSYPYYARLFPDWNEPLLQALRMVASSGERVGFVDVGAATGDTILMLEANAPECLGPIMAIEGEEEFAACLRENTRHRPDCTVVRTMLSATDGDTVASLERHHPGSATASGSGRMDSRSLDAVLKDHPEFRPHLIKIDVDGYDGVVLAGARRVLESVRPAVLFEWHPPLCDGAGNPYQQAFDVLSSSGYRLFLWFDKFGRFQNVDLDWNPSQLEIRQRLCRRPENPDMHWDVLALPDGTDLDWAGLASGAFRRPRTSRW